MFRKIALAALPALMITTSAQAQWFGTNSDQDFQKQQEVIMKQAFNAVGMPAITNFAERRLLKQIFELRDQNVSTYTYLVGMDGHVGQKLCNSVGYGISASTQFTNPQRVASRGAEGITTLPQADPNTLFSPPSAEGTYVVCLNPETNKTAVLYIEPRIIVSPFKLTKE